MTARPRSDAARKIRASRERRGFAGASAIALVDLRRPEVALAVPPDVVAREVEEDLVAPRAALHGALDPVEDDLARVGRVEEEGAPEHGQVAVPHDARLEEIPGGEAQRLAPLVDGEARAPDDVLHVEHVIGHAVELEEGP